MSRTLKEESVALRGATHALTLGAAHYERAALLTDDGRTVAWHSRRCRGPLQLERME